MIEDIRFLKRRVDNLDGTCRYISVLQACDGHVWFDVPLVEDVEPAGEAGAAPADKGGADHD